MSIAERIIERARPIIAKEAIEGAKPAFLFEGKMQTLTRLLNKKDLRHKYGDALQSARTLAELDEIEAKIIDDL
ncbi:MAG: hypothetical protein QNK37_06130 [Acidobacteriota bacterium]|nr:hypothetical protein [Acidobacteriota bacterium]